MNQNKLTQEAIEIARTAIELAHSYSGGDSETAEHLETRLNEIARHARLAELAPELLASLDGILQWWMESDGGDDMPAALFDRARAAIATAKGGAA